MATTTATITLSSADLTGDALSLSTTATLTKGGTVTGLDQTTGVNRKIYTATSEVVLFDETDFGAASEPMRQFYLEIEETFINPDNYPSYVRTTDRQYHQTEKIAWEYLGTKERMHQLSKLMQEAGQIAETDLERKRVRLWKEGVWEYMREGRRKYQRERASGTP